MKGMRELREVLRTVETKATQNFKVVLEEAPGLGAGCGWFIQELISVGGSRNPSRQPLNQGSMCFSSPCHAHGRHC